MDSFIRFEKLIKLAQSYMGMIAEIEMKCRLLKGRIEQAIKNGDDPDECVPNFQRQVHQMRADLAKYCDKLEVIREKLQGYEKLLKLE